MITPRPVLWIAAVVFGGFGAYLALAPEALGEWVGLTYEEPTARIEIRAFYGGLELGLGAFFALAATRAAWHGPATAALACSSFGIALARAGAAAAEGTVDGWTAAAFVTETVLGALGLVAFRSTARTRTPS